MLQLLFAVIPVGQKTCTRILLVCEGTSIPQYLRRFTFPLFNISLTIAAAALVFGAYKYIMSQGNEEESKKARRIILYAIIGLMIIGLAGLIVNVTLTVGQR